jgi:hypothetical protein
MFIQIKTIMTQLLTGHDNTTHDIARWSLALSLIAMFALTGWKCYKNNAPSLLEFAGAAATITGSHCAGMAMKSKTEPSGDEK